MLRNSVRNNIDSAGRLSVGRSLVALCVAPKFPFTIQYTSIRTEKPRVRGCGCVCVHKTKHVWRGKRFLRSSSAYWTS